MRIQQLFTAFKEMRALPSVQVRMWGSETALGAFRSFTRPHPRYRVIQNKRWAVALLSLPDSFDAYLSGKPRQALRTNRKHAKEAGFYFGSFDPSVRVEEILEINASAPVRQGRVMESSYSDLNAVQSFARDKTRLYGVFNEKDRLRAYACTPICGEVFIFSRLLGHTVDLEQGIMYFLVSEVIREMIDQKNRLGYPLWAMYDTFWGASKGLRYFKERAGFIPYRVSWVWESAGTPLGIESQR